MRLTSFAPYVPYRQITHAGGHFLYRYLDLMTVYMDVSLVAPGTPENLAARPGAPPGVDVHLVDLGGPLVQQVSRYLTKPFDLVRGLTPGGRVLSKLRGDDEVWATVAQSQIVEVEWSQYLPVVREVRRRTPGIPVTAVLHDVYAEWLRDCTSTAGSPVVRAVAMMRQLRAPSLEVSLLNRCALTLCFANKDLDLLRQSGVKSEMTVIDAALEWPPNPDLPAEKPVATFAGAMWRPENHEVATWLIRRVWPEVIRAVPEARLIIAGAQPPAGLLRLGVGSVTVTGFVPDLGKVYGSSRVVLAPMRARAGVKVKVLDAMARGLPVIASNAAAAGVLDRVGREAFAAVTDDPDETARALVAVLRDRKLAMEIGVRARDRIGATFDFPGSVARIARRYHALAS